jgi:hypothetical protein
MAPNSSRPYVTTVLLDDERDLAGPVTCPLCHTPATLAREAIEAGHDWRCGRCGQHWDAARMTAAAGYVAWIDERAGRRGSAVHQNAALYRDPPTERPGSAP